MASPKTLPGAEPSLGRWGLHVTVAVVMDPAIGVLQDPTKPTNRGPARAGFDNKVESSVVVARLPGVAFPLVAEKCGNYCYWTAYGGASGVDVPSALVAELALRWLGASAAD